MYGHFAVWLSCLIQRDAPLGPWPKGAATKPPSLAEEWCDLSCNHRNKPLSSLWYMHTCSHTCLICEYNSCVIVIFIFDRILYGRICCILYYLPKTYTILNSSYEHKDCFTAASGSELYLFYTKAINWEKKCYCFVLIIRPGHIHIIQYSTSVIIIHFQQVISWCD